MTVTSRLRKWLTHECLVVRAATLWFLCFGLLTVVWFISYYLLPYGMLRGVFPSSRVPLDENSFLSVFSRISLYNIVVAAGLIVVLNLLSVKSIPLGYFSPLIQICLFGVFLGTDSFAFSQGSRLFPSITIATRPGFYEFTGYVLIAAATARMTLYNQTGFFSGTLARVKRRNEISLSRYEIVAAMLGVLILLVAAAIETVNILTF